MRKKRKYETIHQDAAQEMNYLSCLDRIIMRNASHVKVEQHVGMISFTWITAGS